MKNIFLKIAKVKDEGGFYKKYPTEQSFYEAHPEFAQLLRYRQGGEVKRYSMNRYTTGGPFDGVDYTSADYDAQAAMDAAANTIKEVDTPVQTNSNTGTSGSTITPNADATGQGAPPPASKDKASDKNFFTKGASFAGDALDMVTRNPAATVSKLGNAYLSLGALGSSRSVNSYEKAQERMNQLANTSLNTIPEANTIHPTGYAKDGGTYRRYSISQMKNGGIHINPKNKGKFTESAHRAGYSSVQEYAHHVLANKSKYSPLLVKRANFARNAKLFKHDMGGQAIGGDDVMDLIVALKEKGMDINTIFATLVKKYNVPENMAMQAIKEVESEDAGQQGEQYQDQYEEGQDNDQDLQQAYTGGPANNYMNPYSQHPQQNPANTTNKPKQSNVWDFGSSVMGAAGKIGGELAKNPKALDYINSWMGKAPLDNAGSSIIQDATNTATQAATQGANTATQAAAQGANAATQAAGSAATTAADTAATLGQTAATAGEALAGGVDAAAAATQGLAAAGEGVAAAAEGVGSLASLAAVRNGGRAPKRYSINNNQPTFHTGHVDPRANQLLDRVTKMDQGGLYEGQEIDLDPYTIGYLRSLGYEFE